MIDSHQAIGLIQSLVRIPSESSGATDTNPTAPELGLAQFLAQLCGAQGVDCQVQEVSPGRPNFLARFPQPGRPRLLVVGHLDTVSAVGMEQPFAARIKEGRLWGRGACDDKGPLATALSVLLQLFRQGRPLAYDVTFAGSIDEECSLAGARALREESGGFDLCLCLEPTGLRIVQAHKGVYRCRITTRGRAVHSSAPELGRNAILGMVEVIGDLQVFAFRLGRERHPELGQATLAVTQIAGGASINVIPDRCQIAVDVRLLPGQQPEAVATALKGLLGQRGEVEGLFAARGMQTEMDNPIIRRLQEALTEVDLEPEAVTAGYATDCSELQDGGPCVIWGPGSIDQAHQADEYIELEQVRLACQVLETFLTRE